MLQLNKGESIFGIITHFICEKFAIGASFLTPALHFHAFAYKTFSLLRTEHKTFINFINLKLVKCKSWLQKPNKNCRNILIGFLLSCDKWNIAVKIAPICGNFISFC